MEEKFKERNTSVSTSLHCQTYISYKIRYNFGIILFILILVLDFTVIDIHATKIILTQVVKFMERNEVAFQNYSFYLVSNIISKHFPFRAGFMCILFSFHVLLPFTLSIIPPITHIHIRSSITDVA